MSKLNESLERLSILAAQLNDETDQVNSVIANVEHKLSTLKLGVSVWLSGERGPIVLGEFEGGGGWHLGYTKVGGQWRLVTRPVLGNAATPFELAVSELGSGKVVPLLEAPRLVRVEACGHLEHLVEDLSARITGFIRAIETAKNAVQK